MDEELDLKCLIELLKAIGNNNLTATKKYVKQVNKYLETHEIPNLYLIFKPTERTEFTESYEYAITNLSTLNRYNIIWWVKYFEVTKSDYDNAKLNEFVEYSIQNDGIDLSDEMLSKVINVCFYAKRFDLLDLVKQVVKK